MKPVSFALGEIATATRGHGGGDGTGADWSSRLSPRRDASTPVPDRDLRPYGAAVVAGSAPLVTSRMMSSVAP